MILTNRCRAVSHAASRTPSSRIKHSFRCLKLSFRSKPFSRIWELPFRHEIRSISRHFLSVRFITDNCDCNLIAASPRRIAVWLPLTHRPKWIGRSATCKTFQRTSVPCAENRPRFLSGAFRNASRGKIEVAIWSMPVEIPTLSPSAKTGFIHPNDVNSVEKLWRIFSEYRRSRLLSERLRCRLDATEWGSRGTRKRCLCKSFRRPFPLNTLHGSIQSSACDKTCTLVREITRSGDNGR